MIWFYNKKDVFAKHLCPQNASQGELWTNRENDMLQMAITLKLWKQELWLLRILLLPIEIYVPMKFHVDISNNYLVMAKVKVSGHTDTQKDPSKTKTICPTIFDLGHKDMEEISANLKFTRRSRTRRGTITGMLQIGRWHRAETILRQNAVRDTMSHGKSLNVTFDLGVWLWPWSFRPRACAQSIVASKWTFVPSYLKIKEWQRNEVKTIF